MAVITTTTAAIAVATAAATPTPEQQKAALEAAVAAGYKAAHYLKIEAWTLLAIALVFVILRTVGRLISTPIRDLDPDDYLMWFAALVYTAETTQIHFIAGLGGSNNMPPALRASRTPEEIKDHVLASKLFISGWVEYGMTVWLMKACMCFFFRRLFAGLPEAQAKIQKALYAVYGTYIIVFITTMCECVPFHKNWQVIPDPGQKCTQGLAKHIVILILNVATDCYLITIPIPIFLKSTMPLHRKIIITILFGAGIFVTVAAILRSAFVFQDLYSSTLMATWAVRESCVGFIVNNAPMLSPLYARFKAKCKNGDSSQKSSPFSSKVINTFYSRNGGSAARRKKAMKAYNGTTTLDYEEGVEEEELGTFSGKSTVEKSFHGKSDSTESINRMGITVGVIPEHPGEDDDGNSERDKTMSRTPTRPTTGENRGIRVDVEVELQFSPGGDDNSDSGSGDSGTGSGRRSSSSRDSGPPGRRNFGRDERFTSGHLAGKDKGDYVARIKGPSP